MFRLMLVFISAAVTGLFAQLSEPVIVSPLIGLKYDGQEHMFYNLFPEIIGFIEAEFYLNEDSTVNAKVIYEDNDIIKDSVFRFHNADVIHRYLVDILVNYLKSDFADPEIFRIHLSSGTEKTAYLYSIDENSVDIFDPDKREFLSLKNDEILMISGVESGPYWFHFIGGLVLGSITGSLIAVKSNEKRKPEFLDFSGMENCLLGCITGGVAGLLIGALAGSTYSETIENTAGENGYFYLNESAIMPK